MSLAAPPPSVTPARWMLTSATPCALAVRLSMSPAWWVGVPARPWGLPVGLKCPPALLASAALQSPFSCTWMAWAWPAPRPPIWPVMCTPSPIGAIDSLPLTRLPEADARLTVAELAVLVPGEAGAGDDIGGAAFSPVVEQAASEQEAAGGSRWWGRGLGMADSGLKERKSVGWGRRGSVR